MQNTNDEQQAILDDCCRKINAGEQLLAIIHGVAGTGKSFLLQRLREELAGEQEPDLVTPVAAFTGVAALNCNGQTIHSLLSLPQSNNVTPLREGVTLRALRAKFAVARVLCLDEVSTISVAILRMIDARLRQVRENHEISFGGLSVILLGDFAQLQPVSGMTLFTGSPLYRQFQQVYILNVVMRQEEDQQPFRTLLNNARTYEWTEEDWILLQSRVISRLPAEEAQRFQGAIRLMPRNSDVDHFNNVVLASRRLRIIQSKATHTGPGVIPASLMTTSQQCGLSAILNLSIGSRIMVRQNLSIRHGIVNGSLGEVVAFVQPEVPGPAVRVLVRLDNFNGPHNWDHDPKVVPISRTSAPLVFRNTTYRRWQFPLANADAMTIHKSQGLTLPRVVITLPKDAKWAGLVYVALSRARRIEDIALTEGVPLETLRKRGPKVNEMVREIERLRIQALE